MSDGVVFANVQEVCNQTFSKEVPMRMAIVALSVILSGGVAFAVVGGGDVTMKNKGGDTIFSHETHVVGAELKCQGCHPKLYTNAKQRKVATMDEMEKGKSCGSCHNDKVAAFSVSDNCDMCHAKEPTEVTPSK